MQIKCEYCGNMVDKPPCHIKRHNHHFCNQECCNKWRDKKIKIKCEYCGKIMKRAQWLINRSKHHFCLVFQLNENKKG